MIKQNTVLFTLFLNVFFITSLFAPNKAFSFADVQTKTLESGAEIWVIEDKTVPVISVDFAFKGGIVNDPIDKLGLANFTSKMITQGAGDLSASEFQKQLDDLSISMGFSAGRDHFYGSLKTLKSNQDKAFELLRLSLLSPTFNEDDIERVREHIMASLKQSQAEPTWQMWRNFNKTYYEGYPYSKPSAGTLETLKFIKQDDFLGFVKDRFKFDQLKIVFAGDITLEEATAIVNETFGDLRMTVVEKPSLDEFDDEVKKQTVKVELDIPQTFILMGRPISIDEKSDQWGAALVANYLIGGGSFSSKLMENVRSQEGLSYGISSSLLTQKHADLFIIQTSTAFENLEKMRSTIVDTLNQVIHEDFSQEEIDRAKSYLIGSLPVSLTSTDKLSSAYLSLLVDGLEPDFFDKRAKQIEAVSPSDVSVAIASILGDFSFLSVEVGKQPKVEEPKKDAKKDKKK